MDEPEKASSGRFPFRVYALCLAGFSFTSGVLLALQTGYALRAFGAEWRTLGIVAITLIREHAPRVAALCACIALMVQVHRSIPAAAPSARRVARVFFTVPLGAIVVASLGTAVAALVARGVYEVPLSESWKSMPVVAADFARGVACACGYAVVLGTVGRFVFPFLARKAHWRLLAKLALVWFVSGLGCAVVDVAWELVLPTDADHEPRKATE